MFLGSTRACIESSRLLLIVAVASVSFSRYVQVSLHNPILLRIYMHIVFANTSLFDYPNMGRSLDWVASWCRCVALLSPNGVIRSQDVDLEMLVLAVRIMLRNEYVFAQQHAFP